MSPQLHKRRTTAQVADIVRKYQHREIKATEAAHYLGVGRTRFYQLVQAYEDSGSAFSVAYHRTTPSRRLASAVEKNIRKELAFEKKHIIDDPAVPTQRYNYSYVRDQLRAKYGQVVSVPTIISRAKSWGYYQGKPHQKVHDRQVVTHYTGELIQHDASHHKFAPFMDDPLCLTTSLDDFSRALLYADFWERETTWNHIQAVQALVLEHGVPLKYYVDQLRVFRYVKSRDKASPWREFQRFTDDVDPQWKQVVKDVGIEPVYALSPQAKGKIERPYSWLQDRIVRTCVREQVTTIAGAREVLREEVYAYNWRRVHSTTGEIPMVRLHDAIRDKKSLWRTFAVSPPFTDLRDIFCLRTKRVVDAYRRISLNTLHLPVPGVPPRQEVALRLSPDYQKGVTEIRFWFRGTCVGRTTVKNQELPVVQF